LVDSYQDFGDGDLFENGTQANLNSEMSEKIFTIQKSDSTIVKIIKVYIYEGEENEVWVKTYKRNTSRKWELSGCKGKCKD